MTDKTERFTVLRDWILGHSGVSEAPHRFGGTEFQWNGLEFMHSHGAAFLDIRLSKDDQARVLDQGKALHHRFAPQAGWVSFRLEKDDDLENAKELVELAYQNAKKALDEHSERRSRQAKL